MNQLVAVRTDSDIVRKILAIKDNYTYQIRHWVT